MDNDSKVSFYYLKGHYSLLFAYAAAKKHLLNICVSNKDLSFFTNDRTSTYTQI